MYRDNWRTDRTEIKRRVYTRSTPQSRHSLSILRLYLLTRKVLDVDAGDDGAELGFGALSDRERRDLDGRHCASVW